MRRLQSSEAKLARAKKHLDQLDETVSGFLRGEPFDVEGLQLPDGDEAVLCVKRVPPDQVLGPMIGDVVHNLGSALDALAWDLAVAALPPGTYPVEKVRFPIYVTDRPRDRSDLRRDLQPFPEEIRESIERLQPSYGGNGSHTLWLLRDLWNDDKHRGMHRTTPMLRGDARGGVVVALPEGAPPYRVSMSRYWGPTRRPDPAESYRGMQRALAFATRPGSSPGSHPYESLEVVPTLETIRAFVQSDVVRPLRKKLNAIAATT